MLNAVRVLAGLFACVVLATAPGVVRAAESTSAPPALSFAPSAAPVQSILPNPQSKVQPGAARIEPPHGRVCFNPAETREKITAHKLAEPFRALRMGRLQGEALRAKLCRWKPDEFVYEIAILRRDGRIVHLYMNALNGQSVGVLSEVDRH